MSGRKLEIRALTPLILKEMLSGVPPGHIGAMKASENKGQKNGRKTWGSGAKKKEGRKKGGRNKHRGAETREKY